jgi:hypothetical protein
VIDGSGFMQRLMVFVSFYHHVSQLEEAYPAIFIPENGFKGRLKTETPVKINGNIHVIGGNADVLYPCRKILFHTILHYVYVL